MTTEPTDATASTPLDAAAPSANDSPQPTVEAATPSATPEAEVQRISSRIEDLARLIDEANRIAQDRERIIDRLHEENQKLRAGELYQLLSPILRDLIRLFDDLQRTAEAYSTRVDTMPAESVRDFESYRDVVSDILYRHGVERYEVPEGAPFDAKEQRALGAIPTTEPMTDRTVARVVRVGFRTDTRIIRPSEVQVYRFQDDADREKISSPLSTKPKGAD